MKKSYIRHLIDRQWPNDDQQKNEPIRADAETGVKQLLTNRKPVQGGVYELTSWQWQVTQGEEEEAKLFQLAVVVGEFVRLRTTAVALANYASL